ncbi:MAG: RNA polymerase sigma factor, partial [Thermodesulfobacteriota bacterium]
MEELDGLSDRELVERAVGGESGMFECLVNRHYMLVYRVAYKWCGIRENAEDITQEVFVKLARAIHGFKGGSSFRTWLYRITVNTAKDYLRSSARKMANEGAYMKEREVAAQRAATNGNPVSSEELYAALGSLSPKLKEAVILVLSEGLSHKEAAGVLGCAETTVSWRVFKAK